MTTGRVMREPRPSWVPYILQLHPDEYAWICEQAARKTTHGNKKVHKSDIVREMIRKVMGKNNK